MRSQASAVGAVARGSPAWPPPAHCFVLLSVLSHRKSSITSICFDLTFWIFVAAITSAAGHGLSRNRVGNSGDSCFKKIVHVFVLLKSYVHGDKKKGATLLAHDCTVR